MNVLTPTQSLAASDPMDALLLKYFARLCAELDIPAERWKQAQKAYEDLGKFLCDPSNPLARFNPLVYPQGSARTRTTNRPLHGDEFDIDLICELSGAIGLTAAQIFDEVRVAINYGQKYKGRVTLHNRCVRISFPGFHLDVTPGIPDLGLGPENILITDRPTGRLKNSNPKGFCDDWFSGIANVPPRIRTAHRKASLFETMIETHADVEPVANPGAMRPVLNRITQIYKRHRDVTCDGNKNAPISAIITTLAAHAYAELCLVEHESIYDLLIEVAKALPSKLGPASYVVQNDRHIHTCPNPTNRKENYADKWPNKPERQDAFFAWQADLVAYLERLRGTRGRGTDTLHRELSAGFGENMVRNVITGDTAETKRKVAAGVIGIVSTGAITTRANAVAGARPNTNHEGRI